MAYDDFTDSDGTGLEVHDVKWNNISVSYPVTGLEINSNICEREAAYGNYGAVYQNSQPNDQSSQVVDKAHSTSTAQKHVCVRAGISDSRGYSLSFSSASAGNWTATSYYKNGSYFAGGSTGTWSQASDWTLKIEATGTTTVTLSGWVNAVAQTPRTDTTSPIATGYPGFWGYGVATVSDMQYDDWTDGITAVTGRLSGSFSLLGVGF